jgi:hypothetical protein
MKRKWKNQRNGMNFAKLIRANWCHSWASPLAANRKFDTWKAVGEIFL